MILSKWDDGYVLETDPRREDPLFNYMLNNNWKRVIGFEVDPLYKEFNHKDVIIKIYAPHLKLFNKLNENEKRLIANRVVISLISKYNIWKNIGIEKSVHLYLTDKHGKNPYFLINKIDFIKKSNNVYFYKKRDNLIKTLFKKIIHNH